MPCDLWTLIVFETAVIMKHILSNVDTDVVVVKLVVVMVVVEHAVSLGPLLKHFTQLIHYGRLNPKTPKHCQFSLS